MLEIRFATIEDAYSMAYIHVNSWRSTYNDIIPSEFLDSLSIERRTEYFQLKLVDQVGRYVLAFQDNIPVGFIIYGKDRDDDCNNHGEIWAIYLLKEYWNHGIGSDLFGWAMKELEHMEFEKNYIWVLEDNMNARQFYQKQGFEFDGTVKEITIGKQVNELRYIKVMY